MERLDLSVVFASVSKRVIRGQVEEALEELVAVLKPLDRRLHDETLLHTFSWNDLRHRERQGTLAAEQIRAERARLVAAIVDVIAEAERRLTSERENHPSGALTDAPPSQGVLEKAFGRRAHFREVSWLQLGADAAQSVCRIVTSTSFASGFVVGPGVVATAKHALASPEEAATSFVDMNFELDGGGNPKRVARYMFDASSYRSSSNSDVAVCALRSASDEPAPDCYPALRLNLQPPVVEDEVAIIQHPGGKQKQVAFTGNPVVVAVFGDHLQYLTDTLPGSSGSPVFDANWQVVAVHRRGGYLVTNSRGMRAFVNEGVLSLHLAELLAR